ncbi:hypothetical protein SUNI508_11123 [Seiridium unicorne]|uniref:Uncharacterized protein n=1 Tax=Seiridium unicorne TaxID=138068 RepID=A0ABR2UIU0_9PEZI
MSRRTVSSTASRTSASSRTSTSRYPPGTPSFDGYSYSRSSFDSLGYDDYSRCSSTHHSSESQDSHRYSPLPQTPSTRFAPSDSSRSTYSRHSLRFGSESPDYPSRRSSELSQQSSLRRSSRLSDRSASTLTPKSVTFDPDQVPIEEDEGIHEVYGSQDTRHLSGSRLPNDGTHYLRRVFDDVTREAEQVQHACREFFRSWGYLAILALILVPSLYYGRSTVSDAIQLLRQLCGQLVIASDNIKHHTSIRSGPSNELNFMAHIEPIWDEYSEILENTDYETWFDDARDAEDVITAMWNTISASESETAADTQQITKMKGYIDYRMALRKRAEVNFENFLLARTHVVGEMIEVSKAWNRYVQGVPGLNDASFASLHTGGVVEFAPPILETEDGGKMWTPRNETSYLLSHAAHVLLNRMITLHKTLYIVRELPKGVTKMDISLPDVLDVPLEKKSNGERKLFAVTDISTAKELEEKFIDRLQNKSPDGNLWNNGRIHSTSLQILLENLTGVQKELIDIEHKLTSLKKRLEADIKVEHQRSLPAEPIAVEKGRLVWIQNITELLESWAKMVEKPAASYTRAKQRFDRLKSNMAQLGHRQEVIKWRRENCGGTTCFEVASDRAWGRFVGAAQYGLGFGNHGETRKPFAKRPAREERKVSVDGEVTEVVEVQGRGFYEKMCCGEARENVWLDLLMFGATELVYLDPYRDERT